MIGLAVIGYGYWGPNLARCFGETDGCRVAAIVDALLREHLLVPN